VINLKFNKEQLLNLIDESLNLKAIDISEIPDIDLYMDQVTTFMEDKLEEFKRTKEDKILTKTMINNYTKNKIIPSPKKKKYSKEHMMLLILTYHMKQILSIGDIHSLLSPISENNDVETLYKNFIEIQFKEYDDFSKEIIKKVDELETQTSIHEDASNQLMLYSIIFFLIIQASMQKKLAEILIDNFFIDKNSGKSSKKKS
jgi:hypothetical protein